MGYQTTPNGSLGQPCGLYQFMSNGCFILPSAAQQPIPPTLPLSHLPTPIDSIHDITGTENYLKTNSIQVAGRNSYKMIL